MKKNKFGKKGWTPERMGDLNGKTYVITGTTSGTGFEAARILLSKGAKVVMLNRNPNKAKETINTLKQKLGNNINVLNISMDLAEQASVRKAAKEVLDKVTEIDALICNAAIAQVPTRKLTVDNFESQLGVNHYGHFTLQALLFPLLEKSKGRIVTVKTYACHPGSSRTSLISTSGSLMMRIIFGLMKLSPLTQPAENGAYPMLMCATESDLDQSAFYGPTGRNNWVGPVGAHKLEPHAKDKAVAERLWEVSEKATDLKWDI